MDTRQAVEDLFLKWFESCITIGKKEYMVYLVIEWTIILDEDIISVEEKIKVKKKRKIKKEIKDEIKNKIKEKRISFFIY